MFETIAILAAIASGVALALVNLVLGRFINVITIALHTEPVDLGADFMANVRKYSSVVSLS